MGKLIIVPLDMAGQRGIVVDPLKMMIECERVSLLSTSACVWFHVKLTSSTLCISAGKALRMIAQERL